MKTKKNLFLRLKVINANDERLSQNGGKGLMNFEKINVQGALQVIYQ